MNDFYCPNPIDVSAIELPETLISLKESIAKNVHETWAATRMAAGWKYGPERDDALKLHPDLVPYEDLPEEEKQFDRLTGENTIKFIIKMGYRITAINPNAESVYGCVQDSSNH